MSRWLPSFESCSWSYRRGAARKRSAMAGKALGHASIAMTVDVYGRWLRVEAPGAVNLLSEGFPPRQLVTEEP